MESVAEKLLKSLSETLECEVTPQTVLMETQLWDSLAVVVTVAAIDEIANARVNGEALAACKIAGDVLRLAGVES